MSIRLFVVVFLLDAITATAQNVGIGTNTPHGSASLEISSHDKGILIPRLTTAERDAILSPVNGLLIYNSSENCFHFFNGVQWQRVGSIPKDGIIMSRNYHDTNTIKQGFAAEGYMVQDYEKFTFIDTTIPAFHWYRGNRLAFQNVGAPACNSSAAGYANNNLYVFMPSELYIYNLITDKWTVKPILSQAVTNILVQANGAPINFTGSEFLIWGGSDAYTGAPPMNINHPPFPGNAGVKYNPSTDTWTIISQANAPEARFNHQAVWTGTELIVWGGRRGADSLQNYLNTGGRYNPSTNTWTSLPAPVGFHGREDFVMNYGETGGQRYLMIWGGKATEQKTRIIPNPCNTSSSITIDYDSTRNFNDGRVFSFAMGGWTAMPTLNAPMGRYKASAVWADYQLIIAGGVNSSPAFFCGNCSPLPIGNIPCPKTFVHDSVLVTAAKYDPVNNEWTHVPNAPKAFKNGVAVWDNEQFISIFGEDSVLSFEPAAGDWYQNIIPPLGSFTTSGRRPSVWISGMPQQGLPEFLALPDNYCNSDRQSVYNLKRTPVTLPELNSSVPMINTIFYLYKKL